MLHFEKKGDKFIHFFLGIKITHENTIKAPQSGLLLAINGAITPIMELYKRAGI